jgi:hypothetical protein
MRRICEAVMKRRARRAPAAVDPLDCLGPREQLEALGPTGMPPEVRRAFSQLEFMQLQFMRDEPPLPDDEARIRKLPLDVIREFIERRILLGPAKARVARTTRLVNLDLRRRFLARLKARGGKVDGAVADLAEECRCASRTMYRWLQAAGITSAKARGKRAKC